MFRTTSSSRREEASSLTTPETERPVSRGIACLGLLAIVLSIAITGSAPEALRPEFGEFRLAILVQRSMSSEFLFDGYVCSGVELKGWVVTASHCLEGREAESSIDVVLDVADLCQTGSIVQVEKVVDVWWPVRDDLEKQDVVLLRLESGAEFPPDGLFVSPPFVGEGYVAGFSAEYPNGVVSCDRRLTKAVLLESRACREQLPGSGFDDHAEVCAELDQDFCVGGSGSPLLVNDSLIGVMSWGIGCGEGYPVAFALIPPREVFWSGESNGGP